MKSWTAAAKYVDGEIGEGGPKERSRLYKADLIWAKAPEFWSATILKLTAGCEQGAVAFPNDGKRNPRLIEKADGFELRNFGSPSAIFQVELRTEDDLVNVLKRVQRHDAEEDAGQEAAARQFFDTPNAPARSFTESVCGFHKTV